MTRPTQEQARAAITTATGTMWPSEAIRDTAFMILICDGYDKAASRRAVDREFDAMMQEAA